MESGLLVAYSLPQSDIGPAGHFSRQTVFICGGLVLSPSVKYMMNSDVEIHSFRIRGVVGRETRFQEYATIASIR